MEKLDVIVFGASGYSGAYVVEKLFELIKKEEKSLKWGIAGRSKAKLLQVLHNLESKTDENFSQIPIFEADCEDASSLEKLAERSRLLINCVGPFKIHGEKVIQACLDAKCHYIDITAEPQFMEKVQLAYNEAARERGIYILTACGFDNIPSEMGLSFLEKNFPGSLNSVEVYLELHPDENFKGPFINSGTWESFVTVMEDYQELKRIRRELFPERLPEVKPKLKMRWVHRPTFSQNFAGPYPGGEAPNMRRSQRYFFETLNKRPIQIHTYLSFPKLWMYLLLFCVFILAVPFFRPFGKFLKRFPRFFTAGLIGANPSEETNGKLRIVFSFYGRGWKDRQVDEKFNQVEDYSMLVRVSGRNGYQLTGLCAAASALILLDGNQDVPKKGGVYTQAVFFEKSDLVAVLGRNGLSFNVCEANKL